MTSPSQTAPKPHVHIDARGGLLFAIAAYSLWGVFPIYFKAVEDAWVVEVLAHRIVWSIPFGALLIALRGQWGEVAAALKARRIVLLLGLSATTIAANWLIYIWAVYDERILQASLGYYINPLMYVAVGVFVMRERLRNAQIAAVIIASIGVLVLTFGAGVFPWTSLALAGSFTLYGYIRKTTPVGAMPGLFVETSLLAPFAFIFLLWMGQAGTLAFINQSVSLAALLIFAGPVTVTPLVLFALAARRLRLSTLGFLQYIGPSLQFILGLYFGETFTLAHGVCFALIWTALAIFSLDAAHAARKEHRLNQSA